MRLFPMLVAAFLLVTRVTAGAQSISSALPDAPDRTIKLLREDEDWSFLANPANRQDFWDPLKYIRLRAGRDDWFMTISGEAREVWEQIGNDNWGQSPFWNGYLNERYMLGFDIHYGKHVRTFVELKSGLNSFRYGGPRPIDEKKLDFQAGFLEIGNTWGQNSVAVRAGRLELEYGSGLDRQQATFQRGTAHEVRHTLGARFSRAIATEKAGWDFDYEALWQFGTFGSANIEAWTTASETGYRLPNIPLKPRFSVKADISSGDNPRTNTLATFNPLFPKGNYFGVLATAGPGPINFIDVHPRAEATLPQGVAVSVDWIFQWRESLQDGVYSVPGFLIISAGKSDARFVGHRPGTEVRWQANRHLWFQADYGIFYPGKFVKESQAGRNLNYWALWAGYKF